MRHWTQRIAGALMPRRRGASPGDDSARDGEHGFSIIEVVITITLIALVILPIIDATFTSVKASSTVREAAEIETALKDAADRINRAPTRCEYAVYVQAAAIAKGWDASQASAIYHYYVPGATALAADPGTWVGGGSDEASGCPGGVRSPRLIQKVTITMRSQSGSIVRSVEVVKSDV